MELIRIVLSTGGSSASLQCRVRRQNEKGELFISCLLRYSLNPSSPRTIPTTLPGVQYAKYFETDIDIAMYVNL